MDPDETLRLLRQLVVDQDRGERTDGDVDGDGTAEAFAELFDALDRWIVNGGFLPEAWREIDERSTCIGNVTARAIAAEWHGGQRSAMYSFASTGAVDVEHLRSEISAEVRKLEVGEERRDLLALDKYVRHAGARGPIPGWSRLDIGDRLPVTVEQC